VVTISKLNPTQLESIKQILTLRYSTNLETSSQKLIPEDFETKQITNPENVIEQSIRKSISTELDSNYKKIGISLSSGIDSTLVLALLRKEFPSTDIESISVKFSESTDETDISKKISEKISNILKSRYFFQTLKTPNPRTF